ncbi:MAG: fibronectin type III domain-containing protein, partial [Candidatus Dormibacteraeota bacterium]|nr:fibronectin type III domain-containing protein [Candidatus Dormibacteraeota bacterium]
LVTLSATNAWATGYGLINNTGAPQSTLAEHWDGSTWTIQTSDSVNTGDNILNAAAALPGNDVWMVGGALNSARTNENTLTEQFQLPAPTAVAATPGDNSASVSWVGPTCNGGFVTTGYVVTASDGCAIQQFLPAPTSPFTFPGLTNGTAFNFTVQAVSASLGAETPSTGSGLVTPAGASQPKALTACSTKQFQSLSPSSTNWQDIDPSLSVTVPPAVSGQAAVITGNADLWTATPGVNQDIALNVDNVIVAWKESGGSGGTFSPNAAAVQADITLLSNVPHTIKVQWKSNKSAPGAQIFAGAGPLHGDSRFLPSGTLFSPTRLSVRLFPDRAVVFPSSSTQQYHLSGSDGAKWWDIDPNGGLTVPFSTQVTSTMVITANADLFTANAGFNQDIAINVDNVIVAWKESGGSAGIYSPNAAFVQAVVPLAAGNHTAKLQWKTNKPASGATIFAGAGPLPATTSYSPSSLIVATVPSAADVSPAISNSQYQLPSSDGAGWTVMDSTKLQVPVTGVTTPTSYLLTGNADLWTANAGYNQNIGIVISGGIYGSGTLIAWKESGGSAGTFSPNAAYVETMQHLQSGSYTISLVWKTNKQAAGKTIYAAAGPAPTIGFSPTTLTVLKVSAP